MSQSRRASRAESKSTPRRGHAKPPPIPGPTVRPPVTDRTPFSGLPVVSMSEESAAVLDPLARSRAFGVAATNEVERGALRRFAEALGETNPIYFDEKAARAQGFRGVVAPFGFVLSLRSSDGLSQPPVPNRTVLVSEQQIELFQPICAGDRLLVASRVVEVSQRPGTTGPLEFVVLEEEGRTPEGQVVFRTRRTLIVRAGREQPPAGSPGGGI
jgi:acyl dehydratase